MITVDQLVKGAQIDVCWKFYTVNGTEVRPGTYEILETPDVFNGTYLITPVADAGLYSAAESDILAHCVVSFTPSLPTGAAPLVWTRTGSENSGQSGATIYGLANRALYGLNASSNPKSHVHEWVTYTGLKEQYEYCKHCGIKRTGED